MTETPDTALAALAVQLAALKEQPRPGPRRPGNRQTRTGRPDRPDRQPPGRPAERDPKGPPATFWPVLDADAKTAELAVLTEWVAVMRQWHPSYFEPVADCWASHPEVVIELHNVMTEFTRVYRKQHPPLADALLLYDRWLPGMLRRCHEVMKACGPAGCSRTRHLMYRALYE